MALLHYCANWVGGLGCVPVANRKFQFPPFALTKVLTDVTLLSDSHGRYADSRFRIFSRTSLTRFYFILDAATAEISRSQLWHWVKHGASTQDGQKITVGLVDKILDEETAKTKKSGLDGKRVDLCARYLKEQIRAERLSDFLTTDLT